MKGLEKFANKNMLTKEEVAEAFEVKPTTIQSWMNNGWLTYLKVGSTIRILHEDVEALIKENRFKGKLPVDEEG